ncbi:phage integrase SAM-like domain-containing protein [Mucilaginibacter sp. BT774]|uniref:phage integrase SAM-like domain-containing protein n=1 Tax=Mucilaginibacter sp. BT774 TaxID=3062276 RepID=UPI002674927D|nr:phage integrase SAM-like domain-containing protein [Mucilaginibacter sp. BT774]MDO3626217.1 phage integrase SAM-like domain-containing protein [Mucilaginibacter sp. BT774]
MALVKAVVYEEFKRTDGTYNVKIKVYHQKKKGVIDTQHFLSARQLDRYLKIKDKFILDELSITLADYRKTITNLGPKLDFMTCDNLKDFLEGKDEEVDFVKFCTHHVNALKEDGRDGTAKNHSKIKNSLIDYFGKDRISMLEINAAMLYQYEKWLRRDRIMTRINRFFGTSWKAQTVKFEKQLSNKSSDFTATLTISCVDKVDTRFEIADILTTIARQYHGRDRALYWMDYGNSRVSGQVVLSTLDKIKQPASEQYQPIDTLQMVTEEFKELLQAGEADNTPSCSLAEALTKQELFINSALANCGASLLWQLFREGILFNWGFFLNLQEFRTQPIKVN